MSGEMILAVFFVGPAFVAGLAVGERRRWNEIERAANAAFLDGRRSERAAWLDVTGKSWMAGRAGKERDGVIEEPKFLTSNNDTKTH